MAEDEMERLVNRLDDLEKKANEEITDLKAKNEASQLKLGELEQRVSQQSQHGFGPGEERTSLITASTDRSQADRGGMWHVIGNQTMDGVPSNAFKQSEFTLPDDLCSMFCATSWKRHPFWLSILIVVGLQFTLFILLLIDRVGSNRWIGVGGECDPDENKWCRHDRPLDMPPNVEPLVRAAQALCLIIALYDQEDIRDGLEGFFAGMPVDYKGSTSFRSMTRARWNLSCFFRFLQGFLGVLCAFVLLIQAESVFDVLLNFLGVKFISEMDEAAFHIALKGYFGAAMQEAAEDVATGFFRREEDNRSWILRNTHVVVMLGLLALMITWFAHLAILQSKGTYLIQHLDVDFGNDPFLSIFNGCYSASADGLVNSRLSYSKYGSDVKFGFCKKADKSENGGWTLYFGDSPCPSALANDVLAVSGPTKSFDLPLLDPTKWYKSKYSYSPIELVRITDSHSECQIPESSYFYSHRCNTINVTGSYEQQQLDLLMTTPGEEYPCRDPTTCRPIYVSTPGPFDYSDIDIIYFNGFSWAYISALRLGIDPSAEYLTKDDIRNFFYKGNGFKFETHYKDVWSSAGYLTKPDHSPSPLSLTWYETKLESIWYYNTEKSTSFNIPYANLERPVEFKLECVGGYTDYELCFRDEKYFGADTMCLCNEPIPENVDLSSPQGKAIQDIKNDRRARELCAKGHSAANLIRERYALAVVKHTFGIVSQGWDGNNCTSWLGETVHLSCDNKTSVRELVFLDSNTVRHSGTIPSELNFLTNLEHLDLGQNDVRGQIPGLGELQKLTYLDLFDCTLTGTIPYDLGYLWSLKTLYLSENKLTGSVPFEFSHLSSLELLSIYNNSLTGSIPVELEAIANLTCFAQGNSITGTSNVCQL